MRTEANSLAAFENGEALADWLARHVASLLSSAIRLRGKATLAVSGGSTPRLFLDRLSAQAIDWSRVVVTLADERWVDASHPRSNHRFLREYLLKDKAATARFVPLYRDGASAGDLSAVNAELEGLLPFDAVILGMGNDGHTASLFPGGNRLAQAVADDAPALIDMEAEGAGETRVTLTLPAIAGAREVILHIEGQGKRQVLETALDRGDPALLPIRYVLRKRPDIRIVWAP